MDSKWAAARATWRRASSRRTCPTAWASRWWPITAAGQADNLRQFIAFARAKPEGVRYSSAAIGTSSHLTSELFAQVTRVKLLHVPCKGMGFWLNAVFEKSEIAKWGKVIKDARIMAN